MKKKVQIKFNKKFAARFHHQPHDAIFKYYFSKNDYAKELLTHILSPDLLKSLDLETLEMRPESFVEKDLGMSYSDLLFTCNSEESEYMIYVLYEHKSYLDKNTPLQLLKYILKIWDHFKQSNLQEKFPFVLPIVIYHGNQAWHKNINIFSLMEKISDENRVFVPNFDYILFDLSYLSKNIEEFSPVLRHVLGLMRDRKNPIKVTDWWKSFLDYCADNDIEIEVIFWYITYGTCLSHREVKLVFDEANMSKLKSVRYEDLQGAAAREWYLDATEKGIEKGLQEGIDQAKYIHAKKLLGKLSDEEISEIVELDVEEIKKMRQE